MRYSTTSYPLETPDDLWDWFKKGPAAPHDRLNDRLVGAIAHDTLEYYDPEDLPRQTRQRAVEICEDTPGLSVPDDHVERQGGE